NDAMNVSFYNASDDGLLGTVTSVANGSMAFIVWHGLGYNTTYHWYAVANDSEFETRSDTWTFTTECQVELEPPVINITAPVGGLYFGKLHLFPDLPFTVILGSINITANATDDTGIERVEFYIDNETAPRYTDYEAPYNWTWDEKVFFKHEIKVIAYDEDGRTDTDTVEVFIFNLNIL
ncbi:MAG: Ig-like domain-containing protein, partial [Candidatus Thermoplasmatota archaeon]|nr:Ig-like domain-containing protein [Candidatus Thermoplasmatota archaeon]